MTTPKPTADALWQHLCRVFPTLDDQDRVLSLALYRLLAEGEPVTMSRLGLRSGLATDDATRRIQRWPGVYRDGEQRVIGYWGLSLRAMTHRLRIDGRGLFAWCAWDTLFLPELLGATVQIESVCRGTGQPVRLAVGPQFVQSAEPSRLMLSFLLPEAAAVRADVITSFCHYVHFFVSPEAARSWLDSNPGAFLLTLDEAFDIGRKRNRSLFGAMLRLDRCRREAGDPLLNQTAAAGSAMNRG